MQTTFHPLFRAGCAFTAVALALTSAQLTAADNADAFPTFDSYIKVTGQAASITGDETAFQARNRQSKNGGFGIEDLHILKDLSKNTSLTVDGRALTQSEDYLLSFKLVKEEFGSVDVGYKRYRTFYDGVGGFFPVTGEFRTLKPQDLHIDRGEFWAEIKIARPEAPEFTLRYTNGTRVGQKDSLSWGDSDNAGQVYRLLNGGLGNSSAATTRKNTPSMFDINERHETLEAAVKHKFGNTTARLSLTGDWASKDNDHYVTRFPGETLGVLPGATTISAPVALVTPASSWMAFNNQIYQSTYEIQSTTTKGAMLTTATELTPKLTLRVEGGYQDIGATFSGDRIIVTNAPVTGDLARALTAYNVKNLTGATNVDGWTGKIGLDFKATDDFKVSLALRDEDRSSSASAAYDVVTASTAVPPVIATTSRLQSSVVDDKSLTPVLDVRYTGIKDLTLYLTASNKTGDGTDVQTPSYNPATTTTTSVIYRDVTENNLDFTVGANWRASSALTLRAEPFVKDHSYRTTGWNTNTNAPTAPTLDNNYELDSQFYGVKLTAVVKASDVLGFTTRYVHQKGKMQVTGFLALYPSYDSMDSTMHDLGVTMDWNPNQQFYLQANADLVYNVIKTVSLHNLSVAATGVIPANLLIQNADNNYVNGSLVAGTVLTKTDDLQFRFTYYRADNYNPQLALYTQPYGASATETTATVGLKHKFSDRLIGNFKLGYFDSKNDTTGGNTNFRGPVGYVSLDYAL